MSAPARKGTQVAMALGVALATIAIYGRAFSLGFVGDDVLILERLEAFGGLANPAGYFASGFFTFYRPVAFLSQAVDWELWGMTPFGFHLTNVLLHAANAALVFFIARRLMSGAAAAAAAMVFAAHASNHEAVFWIAGRFDLLAAFWTLLALWLMTSSDQPWRHAAGLAAFGLGLLSKESALAFPLIATGHDVLVRHRAAAGVHRRLAGLVLVLVGYAGLRWWLADLDPTGGSSRLPKAALLAAGLWALASIARSGWAHFVALWCGPDGASGSRLARASARVAALTLVVVTVCASVPWSGAAFLREKLAFAGFASFYLLSPVVSPLDEPLHLDAATPVYWVGGLAVVWLTAWLLWIWRRAFRDGVLTWMLLFVAASLLPVSSMTEGQRYLYLASVGMALVVGRLLDAVFGSRAPTAHGQRISSPALRAVAMTTVALLTTISVWQVQLKGRDWQWASDMTRQGVTLVTAARPAACERTRVVFLTAPVGIRGVYSHYYRDTFRLAGCVPESFTTIARIVYADAHVRARWLDDRHIELQLDAYRGNAVLSRDLRRFDVPLRREHTASLDTPLGRVEALDAEGALRLRLALTSATDLASTAFFYYSDGRIHALAKP